MAEKLHLTIRLIAISIICHLINADCPFPDDENMQNGYFVYEYESDKNLTIASENYLLQYRCNAGYVMKGQRVSFCKQGQWTTKTPRCAKTACRPPPRIPNADYRIEKGSGNRPIVGSVAQYHCDTGYEFENETITSFTCVERNGKNVWEGERPTCVEKMTCPDPGFPSDGLRQGECCYRDTVLTYSCLADYELVGERSIQCLQGAVWSSPKPRCKPLSGSCPDPPDIRNGKVVGYKTGDYYTLYDEVEIKCDPGYSFEGETELLLCDVGWMWEAEFGECKVTYCEAPEPPQNGTIPALEKSNATAFRQDTRLSYVCDEGFRLVGKDSRTCNHGEWSGKEPHCEVIRCPDPGIPENGMRSGNDFSVGSRVHFQCFDGYEILGTTVSYCKTNGQWTGEPARCNDPDNFCKHPGVPINGEKTGSRYGEGDTIEYRCHPGYVLIGSKMRRCLSTGIWSGTDVRCLGASDFDSTDDVSDKLKAAIDIKAKEQDKDLHEYKNLETDGKSYQVPRTIDLSYPGRYILYFIFDASGSVEKENFLRSIKFAKALVKKIGITEDGARAAAITFSSKTKTEFLPVDHKTTNDVLEALDAIEYTKGGTFTTGALEVVRKTLIPQSREYFGVKNVKSVIFILTDGKANMGGSPQEEAKRLKDANVEIYCIGISGSIKVEELYDIASKPIDEHVFILHNYNIMDWLIQELTNGTIDYSKCGLGLEATGKELNRGRIYGGDYAMDPWPWMAAVLHRSQERVSVNEMPKWDLKCGGSIIQQPWILTAAHCVTVKKTRQLMKISDITIKLGLTDKNNHSYLQQFEVEDIYIHEDYNPRNLDADIALIKLDKLIQYNAFVRPICLPPTVIHRGSLLYKTKEIAFATGWGYTRKLGVNDKLDPKGFDRQLKEVELPLPSSKTCLDSFIDNTGTLEDYTKNMMCAGDGSGSSDTCEGDSGGPLMQSQMNVNGSIFWTQVGIVSFGIKGTCGKAGTYGYYSHVHNLLPFIKSTVTRNL